MSNNVLNWVWRHSRSKHGSRLVLLALADRARENGVAWPSVADLKQMTGLGDRAVQAAIIDCAKLGELEVGYQQGPKGCNRYRLLMPPTPADSAGAQDLRGAESAPPQESRGPEFPQVNTEDPADSAPPAISAPPQNATPDPAESADVTLIEPSPESSTSSRRRDLNEGREDAVRLCVHLADRIEGNTGERPDIAKKWITSARLMLDNDKRSEDQVHRAIDWCQDSEFWRCNILSMPKLREQYQQLQLQAKRKSSPNGQSVNGHRTPTTDQRVASIQALKAGPDEAQPELPPNTITGSVIR